MEKLLIEQIILCWPRLYIIELIHHSNQRESHTITSGIYLEKLLTNSQKRFMRAVDMLMRVRKMQAQMDLSEAKRYAINLVRSKKATPLLKALTD